MSFDAVKEKEAGFTLSGHLGQQLVSQLLWEDDSLPEAPGAVRQLHAEQLQVVAHIGEAQVGQSRGGRVVLKPEDPTGYK